MTKEWLTVPCIARKLKVSRDKVRRWVKCGELRGSNLASVCQEIVFAGKKLEKLRAEGLEDCRELG